MESPSRVAPQGFTLRIASAAAIRWDCAKPVNDSDSSSIEWRFANGIKQHPSGDEAAS